MVMEMLWDGKCLDENGEIQALPLSKLLFEKHGLGKTSCYTFFSRLLEKGAITRRYPKYTLKPVVSRSNTQIVLPNNSLFLFIAIFVNFKILN